LADIARGLAARGHEVSLAAATGSYLPSVRVLDLGVDARTLRPAALLAQERADEPAQHAAFGRARRWLDEHEGDVAHAAAYDAPAVAPHVHQAPDWRLGDGVVGAMYVGPRPRSELHRIFGAARATCMPVRWEEPFGIVALESLAAGTPVVASARGGLRELVDH